MNKRTTTMLGTILAALALMAFAGPAFAGGNGKGNGADPHSTTSAPGNSGNAPGQVKKAEQAQQAEPSASADPAATPAAAPTAVPPPAQPETPAPATEPAAPAAPVAKEVHGKSKPDRPAKPKRAAAPSAPSSATVATAPVGVKPSNSTSHNVSAQAGSSSTKLYGNGQTAGQIAMKHGASPSTMLYGPGNSQPHKVAPCGRKAHGNGGGFDVHALKSHGGQGGCAEAASPAAAPQVSPRAAHTATPDAPARAPSVAATSAATSAAAAPPATERDLHTTADQPKPAGGSTTTITRREQVHAAAPYLPPRMPFSPRTGHGATSTRVVLTAAPKGTLPFTGLQLWALAAVGLGLVGAGWTLRRHAHPAS